MIVDAIRTGGVLPLQTTADEQSSSKRPSAREKEMASMTQSLPKSVIVSFSAEIVPNTTEQLIAAMARCANDGVEEVALFVSTPGGSVAHGITLYNTLRAMPFALTTHNVGAVNSIGNVVFLAGDTRYAASASSFMFHGVGFNADGGTRLEEKLLVERLDSIRADQDRIGQIIAERTDLDDKAIGVLFLEQSTKNPQYAMSHGIIADIREPEVPTGVPVLSLVFQR